MAGPLGVVAAGHESVARAAEHMLRAGGNAFDAALAAGFTAAVAEPMFTSLGGGGFLLARTAAGDATLFDFFVDTPGRGLPAERLEPHFEPITVHFPGSDQVFNMGLGSVATPGNVAGFLHVHERLGSLPLSEVVAPAAGLARDGIVLNDHQAYVIGLLVAINTWSEEGRALFAPEGRTPVAGERLHNPDLAAYLESLPRDGAGPLYEGALARRVDGDMRDGQGLLTAEDLSAYRVIEREPLAIDYRGTTVLTNPPPSSGGSLIAESLSLLEKTDLAGAGWGSPPPLSALVSVMEQVEQRRGAGGTTHLSVRDAAGNAASLSLSNGEGSGYFVPGTGIMLNNMLGEDDLHPEGFHASPPGERVSSMMSPSLVLGEHGDVRLIVGSGGSKRIRTALLQVISNVVDFGRRARDAVEAPRLHWDGEQVQAEPGFPDDALEALRARWRVNAWQERNLYFGGVHAVEDEDDGWGDPRRGGHALVVR